MKTPMETTVLTVFSVLLTLEVARALVVNVALGKPTAQINSILHGESNHATDGILNPHHGSHSCTHTISDSNTWWMVDLLQPYDIYTVRILNRFNHGARLQDFSIFVSMVNPLPIPGPDNVFTGQLCLRHQTILSSEGLQTLNCNQPVKGRFVYVWKPSFGYLTMCEFQVLVNDKAGQSACTISHGQKSLMTSVYSTHLNPLRSLVECVYTCQSVPERLSNLIQFNKTSGKCDCILFNDLVDAFPSVSPDQDFDVCRVD